MPLAAVKTCQTHEDADVSVLQWHEECRHEQSPYSDGAIFDREK